MKINSHFMQQQNNLFGKKIHDKSFDPHLQIIICHKFFFMLKIEVGFFSSKIFVGNI